MGLHMYNDIIVVTASGVEKF